MKTCRAPGSVQEDCGVWLDTADLRKKKKAARPLCPISWRLNPLAPSRGYCIPAAVSFTQTRLRFPTTTQSAITAFLSPLRHGKEEAEPAAVKATPLSPPDPGLQQRKRKRLELPEQAAYQRAGGAFPALRPLPQACLLPQPPSLLPEEEEEEEEPPAEKRVFVPESSEPWADRTQPLRYRGKENSPRPPSSPKPTPPSLPPCTPLSNKTTPLSPKPTTVSNKTTPLSPKTTTLSNKTTPLSPKTTPLSPKTTPLSPKTTPLSPKTTPVSNKTTPLSPKTTPLSPNRSPRCLSPRRSPLLDLWEGVPDHSQLFTQDSEGRRVIAHRGGPYRLPLQDCTNSSPWAEQPWTVPPRPLPRGEPDSELSPEVLFTQDSEGNRVIRH